MKATETFELAQESGVLSENRAIGLNKLYLVPKKLEKTQSDSGSVISPHFILNSEKEEVTFSVKFGIVSEGILKVKRDIDNGLPPGLFDVEDYTLGSELIRSALINDIGDRPIPAENLIKFQVGPCVKEQLLKQNILKQDILSFKTSLSFEPAVVDSFIVEDHQIKKVILIVALPRSENIIYQGAFEYLGAVSTPVRIPGTELSRFEVTLKNVDYCVDVSIGETPDKINFTRFK